MFNVLGQVIPVSASSASNCDQGAGTMSALIVISAMSSGMFLNFFLVPHAENYAFSPHLSCLFRKTV